jgi:hypothetical protein
MTKYPDKIFNKENGYEKMTSNSNGQNSDYVSTMKTRFTNNNPSSKFSKKEGK